MAVDETILRLVQEESIENQATLRERLRDAGYSVTQPTLSRHLKRLRVRKIRGAYRQTEQSADIVPGYLLTVAPPNLVILKTKPGHAQVLAVLLDSESLPDAAGSVAGDDTVFIAARAGQDPDALAEHIRTLLNRDPG